MSKHYRFDNSKSIEDMVKKALDSDLSKLKDLGPAVQKTVSEIIFGSQPRSNDGIPRSTPYSSPQPGRGHSTQSPPAPQATPVKPARSSASYPPPQGKPLQSIPPSPTLNTARPRLINRHLPRGLPQIILGSLGVVFFGVVALLFAAAIIAATETIVFVTAAVLTGACAIIALVCAWLLASGVGKYKLADRVTRLINFLQGKKVYTLDELAAETNRSPKQIQRDLEKMQSKGLLPELRTDAEEKCVMWGQDTYEQYLKTKEARLQKKREEEQRKQRLSNPATADIEFFRSEGETVIKKIRAANDALPGEEISAKLDVLEDTVTRIFTYVERYPEKLPETRKFMNYYLPTTLKLVEKYHQYDGMDFEPQNVRQAKTEIERSMDTINVAFNNLLESLFHHDTLDVATDIDVLEKMLEQEGLTGKTFKIDQPGSAPKLSLQGDE